MATIKQFEEIEAWKIARDLSIQVYSLTKNITDYSFRDQIRRASVSVMNNIAEGFERQSNKEFRQFLFISKGSAGEVRSMALLAEDLGYFQSTDTVVLVEKCTLTARLISGLIKVL